MEIKTERFAEMARPELQSLSTRTFLKTIPPILEEKRELAIRTLPDPAAALACGAFIKEEALARLPELLEEFEEKALANGAQVLWARDGREANEHVWRLARERGIEYLTKGKSMLTEELGLNDFLAEKGVKVWETDLGEFITQQLHLPPFHIVGPAINIPVEEVRDLFLKKANLTEPTLDPVRLGYAARLFLRDKLHRVRLGITGVNLAVAETGTIINVENEGNIRLCKSSPLTQVSIMSLEKIVPRLEDALLLLRLLSRSCTGQRLTAYVSMDSGPKRKDEADGPEELIIIIVDNGRSAIYGDRTARQALRCIRCAACLNICPVYRQIGGYAYGWAYSGPMGQVLNPLLLGLDRTQDLYRATTLCGACRSVCPVGIDHPGLFLYFRTQDVAADPAFQGKKRPLKERLFFGAWSWALNRSWRWNLAVRMMRRIVNRQASGGSIRRLGNSFSGWFRSRDLPAIPERTFRER